MTDGSNAIMNVCVTSKGSSIENRVMIVGKIVVSADVGDAVIPMDIFV